MAIKAIINNTEKEIEQIKNSDEQDVDYVYSRIGDTEVEGEPSISIKSIGGNLADYRIYGNTVGGESVGDLVESGEHAGEYEVPVIISRKAKHTATLQLHDCLPSIMQFDAREALYYAEKGLTAGTYNFTIQDGYDTSYGGGKTYQFTLANDVPAKGQLVFGWSFYTQASAAKITSYASSTSTTAIEQVGVTKGSGGTSLGTTDGNSTNVNHIHRARYGSNNYKESAIRQFLNSSAVAGSVWTPQTKYDRPPSWNASTAGFMKDIDSDFLAVLGASPKVVALNTVTDGGGSVTINNDKFFLLSRSEVYGGKKNNINEGEPYPYYSNYSDLSAAGVGDDSNRIKYRSGTAQVWWLRSPDSAYGNGVYNVWANGYVGIEDNAGASYGVAPACNIELDDNYAYKGQVLHVRDQISVQKGNDTLIFDVIGIDHDDVDFDVTTTPIYLPEQIRKVGDEAEYIDYSEQKLHRVRKNLLQNQAVDREIEGVTFTVNSDGSITCNGTASDNTNSGSISSSSLPAGSYYLNGTPSGGSLSTYYMYIACYTESEIILYNDVGDGVSFTIDNSCNINVRIGIVSGCTCNNLTFYPMIRKADIEDDTYEPYIENTEVDITLPALSTIKGTNTFSVNTSIQPSNIYIKDGFDYKKVFTATRVIEDELPLSYRSIEDNDSALSNYRIYGNTETKTRSYSGSAPLSFPIVDGAVSNYRIYGNTVNGESVGKLVTDSQSEHYGKYAIPITNNSETANIYLDEPLRKVGDEAEYVDYATQKWHRVRKNLFSTELEQGNISIDGTLLDSESRLRTKNYLPCEKGDYVLSFSGENIKFGCRCYDANYDLIASTSWMKKNSVFSIDRINTKYIKLNFAKNNTTENISPSDITDIQLEKGSTATEYEPYIENTEVDVTIPALPAQSSINSLSVGTSVQPSSVAVDVDEVVSCGDKVTDSQSVNYGKYKIPVTLTAGSAETTDIYLDEPLAKSGNNADYIDYATQKRHNSDGTESSVTLPEIAVTAGTNTLTIGTEVQPSSVEIKGHIK